jgi:GNAT superfamily N-acetyltransferase
MTIIHRQLQGMDDVMAVRAFLSDVYGRTGDGRVWEIRRWEGMFWHDDPSIVGERLSRPSPTIRLWFDGDRIVAAAHPEGVGDVHLQIAPGYEYLADAMLAWAESTLAVVDAGGRQRLTTFALDDDGSRRQVLTARGFAKDDWHMVQRWRDLTSRLPEVPVAAGYAVRPIVAGDAGDAGALAGLINAAFGHAFGPEAIANFERSPSFDADLQMVAIAPNGTFASHSGVTIDASTSLAIVEPVCTHPDHRRLGLATACMAAGLVVAAERGATRATVGTGHDNPSNDVYEALGFAEVEVVEAWSKTW